MSSVTDLSTRHVAIIGAGVAGLAAAVVLARDGHRVTLVERDRLDGDAEQRSGTPQARHSHAFLGRLRKLLATELPDVLADLHAAGATDYRILDDLPDTVTDRTPRPGDDDLVLLACRRSTFEAVLRRAALRSPNVRLLDGVGVTGLVATTDGGGRPTVTGVRLDDDTVAADLVVGAGGPRSPVPAWLEAVGITVPETYEESGIVYLSRFYHLAEQGPADRPRTGDALGLSGADLGYIKCAVFRGDNDTFSVTLAPRAEDDELRSALRDEEGFDRAGRLFPPIAPWLDPDRSTPLTGVNVMARLGNRRRRFLDDAGRPSVLGFHALGDAHTATNPLYGRGCTMAVLQATLLAGALRDHPDDADARASAYEAATQAEIEPWYDVAVAQDRFGRKAAEAARTAKQSGRDDSPGRAAPRDDEVDGAAFVGKVVRDGLLPASRTDPVVARAFLRVVNALQTPQSLMADADVTGRVMRTMAEPPPDDLLPDYRVRRRDLLAALR